MEQIDRDFPSNESVDFCRFALYFHYIPHNSRIAMVVASEEPIGFYTVLGFCAAVFFGVVLQ
jgi:hypothetical protein